MTRDVVTTDGLMFHQKRLSNRVWFTFRDDDLEYRFEDAQHARKFRLDYRELPFTHTEYTEKFEALRGTTFVFSFLALLNGLRAIGDLTFAIAAVVMVVLAGASWLGYKKLSATFTVIDTDHGRMLAIHDGQYDRLMGELAQRRRDAFLAEFGDVDDDNDPEEERRKFAWLRDRGVLTEDEYQQKLAEIGGGVPSLPTAPGGGTVH